MTKRETHWDRRVDLIAKVTKALADPKTKILEARESAEMISVPASPEEHQRVKPSGKTRLVLWLEMQAGPGEDGDS